MTIYLSIYFILFLTCSPYNPFSDCFWTLFSLYLTKFQLISCCKCAVSSAYTISYSKFLAAWPRTGIIFRTIQMLICIAFKIILCLCGCHCFWLFARGGGILFFSFLFYFISFLFLLFCIYNLNQKQKIDFMSPFLLTFKSS